MTEPVTLPPKARQMLVGLFTDAQRAKALYDAALTAAVCSAGFDPDLPNNYDLDTGTISPAPVAE